MKLPDEHYLKQLNHNLSTGNLVAFERLINRLNDEGIYIDLIQLSQVEQKISGLFLFYLFPTFNIDAILRTFKFANDFALFKGTSKKYLFPISDQYRQLLTENLQSMFGVLSEGFFHYMVSFLPNFMASFFSNPHSSIRNFMMLEPSLPLSNIIETAYFYCNSYMNYGLRTRNVGTFDEYLIIYEENKEKYDEDFYFFNIDKTESLNTRNPSEPARSIQEILRSFSFFEEHLVYAPLLERIKIKFRQGKYGYEYPIVSMVTSGGVGPEGKGFAYLTPRGEIIEVCSDLKQNKAYIIEYKKYLKSIFLDKLVTHMQSWSISDKLKNEILFFFKENIQTKMVGYKEIEILMNQNIFSYLERKIKSYLTPNFKSFLKKSLLEILIPVQMEDQFKVRMDLIKNNQLTETEVAKLVSLGEASHLDILNQRLFFLHLVDNTATILKQQKLL